MMKPATLLTLCFLLFAFTTDLPLAFSQHGEQVLDTEGNPIFPGGEYFIVPGILGPYGGGVFPGETGSQTCPVTVLQDYSWRVRGNTVKFRIASTGSIFPGTPLDIAFERKPECAESAKWVVVSDGFLRPWVGIGGAKDHPGKEIISGKFKIQKYQLLTFGYNLEFCPTLTSPPGHCFDIGRLDDVPGRRLIIAGEDDPAFQVVFIPASTHLDVTG